MKISEVCKCKSLLNYNISCGMQSAQLYTLEKLFYKLNATYTCTVATGHICTLMPHLNIHFNVSSSNKNIKPSYKLVFVKYFLKCMFVLFSNKLLLF